jgi:hypothetical protein
MLLSPAAVLPFFEILLSFFVPTEDGHERIMMMQTVEDNNLKMDAFAVQRPVREAFLAAIVQEGKIYLQSHEEASLFLHFPAISIHRMRTSILTRPSDRPVIRLVRQSQRNTVNFGMAVLTRPSFHFVWALLDISPDHAFSLNGNGTMPYTDLLAGDFASRDAAHFSSQDMPTCKRLRPFPSGLRQDLPERIYSCNFMGALYWSHDVIVPFSPCPIFKTRNFFLPVAFDIMG